ncbi:ATP-binding protein [Clostridia bacterium]|nr:ATP-binding protein [Clostridia bacterium]
MKDILQKKIQELRETIKNSPKEKEEVQYECPICKDRGLIYKDGQAYICNCVNKKRFENQFKHARLAGEYLHKSFDDFQIKYYSSYRIDTNSNVTYRQLATQCLTAAKLFTDSVINKKKHKGMYVYGTVGSGKTLLTSCIANRLLEHNIELLFISVPDFLDEIKATFNQKGNQEMDLMNQVRNVRVLILDDLGAHTYTDWSAGRIYNIINYRASNNLSTIITSNLSVDGLAEALDERTSSRVMQLCTLYRLETEEDIRCQVYKENLKRV